MFTPLSGQPSPVVRAPPLHSVVRCTTARRYCALPSPQKCSSPARHLSNEHNLLREMQIGRAPQPMAAPGRAALRRSSLVTKRPRPTTPAPQTGLSAVISSIIFTVAPCGAPSSLSLPPRPFLFDTEPGEASTQEGPTLSSLHRSSLAIVMILPSAPCCVQKPNTMPLPTVSRPSLH